MHASDLVSVLLEIFTTTLRAILPPRHQPHDLASVE
jgi:hypothetical protein